MDVVPFAGFGTVRLGMSKEQLIAELGEPDTRTSEFEGDESFQYRTVGVSCDFCADDGGLLGSMTFHAAGCRLGGFAVVGIPEAQLLALGTSGALPGLFLEDDFPYLGAKNYECESLGLSFWVSDAVVENMTIFPRYDASGDQPIWPSPDDPDDPDDPDVPTGDLGVQ